MREIKFRGKNYDGIWIYGYLTPTPKPQIHLGNKHSVCMCPQKMSRVDMELYEVEENTIGQYTGLKDKNDKEIYEGDIIVSENYSLARHYVRYIEDEAMFVAMIIGSPLMEYCGIRQSWIDKFGKKIIGNIHDNPDLIKKD